MKKLSKPITATFIAKVACLTISIALCVWLGIAQSTLPNEQNPRDYSVGTFNEDWYWVQSDGTRVAITVPGQYDIDEGETAYFEKVVPSNLDTHTWLSFRTSRQDMNVYIDGELRESYTTKDTRPFGLSSASNYIFMALEPDDAGKIITLEISSHSSAYTGVLRSIMCGDKMGIVYNIFADDLPSLVLALFMAILSVGSIIIGAILQFKLKRKIHLIYLGWSIFAVSVWLITQSKLRQAMFYNVSATSAFSQFVLFLLPIPFAFYLDRIQGGRYRSFYLTFEYLNLAVFAACVPLIVFNVKDQADLTICVYILFFLLIALIAVTFIRDVITKDISQYKLVANGVLGVIITGVIQIAQSMNKINLLFGQVLCVGLIYLLVMACAQTISEVMTAESEKQQAMLVSEARAQFLASMSHEIRTPINAVLGFDEIILRETSEPHIREYAEDIQTAGRNLLAIVNDILDFSRIESGKMSIRPLDYDLSSVINDCCNIVRVGAEKKGLLFQSDCDPTLPNRLYGDEVRIRQILNNLLSNAVKYTNKGSVTLEVKGRTDEDGNFTLIFVVRDTGIGIDKENLPLIFDSFSRSSNSTVHKIEGTGLGLSIVHNLTTLMDGEVTVESVVGLGSSFTVCLPQKVVSTAPIGNLTHTYSSGLPANPDYGFIAPNAKLLVVDDVPMNLKVFCGMLKDTLIRIDTAESGWECLKKMRDTTYDIIFLDHMMPELDGLQTLAQINSMGIPNQAPVIMLTANAILGAKEEYLSMGFHDYLSKPIQKEKLLTLLRKYLPGNLIVPVEQEASAAQSISLDKFDFLDTNLALSYYSGDVEFYLDIVKTFAETDNVPKIQECYLNEDWGHYQLMLHSLKSSSRSIGAVDLSSMAWELESAAKRRDVEFIRANHERAVLTYQELLARLGRLFSTAAVVDDAFDILVVDDDKINLKTAQRILEKLFRVTCVESGAEALDAVKKNLPDLILLDIHMPEVNGFDVLEKLKSNELTRDVPVIFLSADTDADTERNGLKAGAVDFIHKPFIPDVMLERINRAIQQDRMQQHLQEEVAHKTNKVEELSLQAMLTLAQTIDAKDKYTKGHSSRVATYSKELAKELGLSEEDQENIYYMGLLHDIGKIGVPDYIITKPGRLTDEEFALVKKHPETGYDILRNFNEFPHIETGARWHHERYDGKGYPDGLAGEQIPFLVRILSVADAYDAMASQRSYREELPREYILSELEKGKGTQFDSQVAQAMIQLLTDGKL